MKIGILGVAHHHAYAYLRSLSVLPDVECVGIADADRQRRERFTDATGCTGFDSYDRLLELGLDGAIVCTETRDHRQAVERAALAGVQILCEKPLATGTADATAIVDTCARTGVNLMTAFPMRFSRPVLHIEREIARGAAGRPVAASSRNQGELPKRYGDWFVDRSRSGGGCVADHVVHLADLFRWLFRSEVATVYAVSNRIVHRESVAVETGGLVGLTFANGAVATIDCSWSRPKSWPTWGGLSFELVTDRGVVRVDAFRQNVELYDSERTTWIPWGDDANTSMIGEFVDALRNRRAPVVTGHDGLRAVEIVEAAYRSIESGTVVAMNPAEPLQAHKYR